MQAGATKCRTCSWVGCAKYEVYLPSVQGCHVCSKCNEKGRRDVPYCTNECQVRDWLNHKAVCGVRVPSEPSRKRDSSSSRHDDTSPSQNTKKKARPMPSTSGSSLSSSAPAKTNEGGDAANRRPGKRPSTQAKEKGRGEDLVNAPARGKRPSSQHAERATPSPQPSMRPSPLSSTQKRKRNACVQEEEEEAEEEEKKCRRRRQHTAPASPAPKRREDIGTELKRAKTTTATTASVVGEPENWPSCVKYITKNVECYTMEEGSGDTSDDEDEQNDPDYGGRVTRENVRIIKLPPSHPAYKPDVERNHNNGESFGIVARRSLPKDSIVGEYVGVLMSATDGKSLYRFKLTSSTDVDAIDAGNELRFLNDYRDTGHSANVVFVNESGRILVKVLRPINKGEELLVDYGEDTYWLHARDQAHTADDDEDEVDDDDFMGSTPREPSRAPNNNRQSRRTSNKIPVEEFIEKGLISPDSDLFYCKQCRTEAHFTQRGVFVDPHKNETWLTVPSWFYSHNPRCSKRKEDNAFLQYVCVRPIAKVIATGRSLQELIDAAQSTGSPHHSSADESPDNAALDTRTVSSTKTQTSRSTGGGRTAETTEAAKAARPAKAAGALKKASTPTVPEKKKKKKKTSAAAREASQSGEEEQPTPPPTLNTKRKKVTSSTTPTTPTPTPTPTPTSTPNTKRKKVTSSTTPTTPTPTPTATSTPTTPTPTPTPNPKRKKVTSSTTPTTPTPMSTPPRPTQVATPRPTSLTPSQTPTGKKKKSTTTTTTTTSTSGSPKPIKKKDKAPEDEDEAEEERGGPEAESEQRKEKRKRRKKKEAEKQQQVAEKETPGDLQEEKQRKLAKTQKKKEEKKAEQQTQRALQLRAHNDELQALLARYAGVLAEVRATDPIQVRLTQDDPNWRAKLAEQLGLPAT